jgi:hypothetical protein
VRDRVRHLLGSPRPARPDQRYPHAAQLFGCYLHQDWPEDAGTWQAAVDQFLARESADHAGRVAADVARLLVETPDDAALRHALDAFGNAYDPVDEESATLRDWLGAVVARIRAALPRDA